LVAAVSAVRRRRPGLLTLLALLLVAAIAAGAWAALQLQRANAALAERLVQLEAQAAATASAAEQRARAAQAATEQLRGDLERLQNQRGELDQLYLDLTRGRDEAALAEIERLVAVAAQELQLTGNVATAIAALQSVDARLARIDRPQLVNLRRALTRDLERLRSTPAVDVTGLALKLDQMIQGVDGLTLVAEPARKGGDGKGSDGRGSEVKSAAVPAAAPTTDERWWPRARAWLREEFGDLVRIREVDTPEALLLNDAQQRLARQQLRLRLLNARQSLLMRNDQLYRADLAEAQALLARYFDGRQAPVMAASGQLKAMAQAPLSVEVPQITETLAALQNSRGGRAGR
jgi:uroporphyrinogen III methyltransferase/synthase